MNDLKTIRISYLFGIISFILYSASYLIGYEEESENHIFVLVKACLILVSALLYFLSSHKDMSEDVRITHAFLAVVIILHEVLLVAAVGKTIFYVRDYVACFNSIIWILFSSINIIRFRNSITAFFRHIIKERQTLILVVTSAVLAIVVIVFSIEPSGVRFSWDSNTLYGFVYGLSYDALYDSKQLLFSNHLSCVYVYLLCLFKFLLNDIRAGFFMLSSLCIVAASYGMTFLMKSLLPNRSPVLYVLADAMFLFSPWVCGVATYHIYDYYIWCLFPLLIYYCSRKNWIGFYIVGILISFSKSPGVIVFGSVCIGILISDLFFQRKVISIIKDIKYWLFASVAIVFLLFYGIGVDKSAQFNDTLWGFDAAHIIQTLKIYSTANFLWLFVAFSGLYLISMIRRKKLSMSSNTKSIVAILVISDVVFILFNIICITYHMPRYMDSHIATVFILSSMFLVDIEHKTLRLLLFGGVISVNLISSFYTVDPVSLAIFNNVYVGDHNVISFEKKSLPSIGDSIIYNRDYYSYEVLLGRVLSDIINERNADDEIMFSLGNQPITWGYSCGRYSYAYSDGKRYFEEFYDKSIGGLANGYDYEYYDLENMVPLSIRYVFNEEFVENVIRSSDADIFYYIYMPTLNQGKEETIFQQFKVLEFEEKEFRGWKMNFILFEK